MKKTPIKLTIVLCLLLFTHFSQGKWEYFTKAKEKIKSACNFVKNATANASNKIAETITKTKDNILNSETVEYFTGINNNEADLEVYDYKEFIENYQLSLNTTSSSKANNCAPDVSICTDNEYDQKHECQDPPLICEVSELSASIIEGDFSNSTRKVVKFLNLTPNSIQEVEYDNDEPEVVICISGFTSQKDDYTKTWEGVIKNKDPHKEVFAFKWPSNDVWGYFKELFGNARAHRKIFSFATKSGKLLAHALIMGYPKRFSKVTFVSFSLGCEVVRSCLEELHRLNATKNFIEEVYLMAGATEIAPKDYEIFSIINKKLVHIYTPLDWILKWNKFVESADPIGRKTLNKKLKRNIESLGIEVEQYDISEIADGHGKFRGKLDLIMRESEFH
ncbi:unnamed protein product [Moneuplotes crassus]|uniref:Uncharacterized protein n=1 Tax=Euplotes crassus TaxID=5936 RepID=A0AAD2DAX1_EUPCR|nr:unnamed protein product [Moneuplotes crassus]